MFRSTLVILCAACGVLAGSPAFAQVCGSNTTNTSFASGATGWNVTGLGIELNPETVYGGTDAANMVAEVDTGVDLDQDVTLVAGTTYRLSMRTAHRQVPCAPAGPISVQLSMTNTTLGTQIITRTAPFAWVTESFLLTATAATSRLRIQHYLQSSTCGFIIDDITLVAVEPGESCDDGNSTIGDGCDTCSVSPGYSCSGTPSSCTTGCGNGVIGGAEACDDGNTQNGDGCSSACVVETNYTCTTQTPAALINGGLELPAVTTANATGSTVTGWSVDFGNVDVINNLVASAYGCAVGNGCVDLTGNTPGSMYQDFVTTAGANYVVTFRLAANCVGSCARRMSITVANPGENPYGRAEYVGTYGANQLPLANAPYGYAMFRFSAVGSTTRLRFNSHEAGASGAFIDHVAIPASYCNLTTCGNGTIGSGETCDDGNRVPGDGCSPFCAVEEGFACVDAVTSVCTANCNDGIWVGAEACDDGNGVAADGCTTCTVNAGYNCALGTVTARTQTCTAGVVCGNGTISSPVEECDDSNTTPNDGCSALCQVEANSTCAGQPSVCAPLAPSLLSPDSGTFQAASTIAYSGTANPSLTVRLFHGATEMCNTTSTGLGAFACSTAALDAGTYVGYARAYYGSNGSAPSNSVTVTIDNVAPAVPVISVPVANAVLTTTTPTFSGTGEAQATVRVFVDDAGTAACSTVAADAGTWSCLSSALGQGAHNAIANQVDRAGNTSIDTVRRPFSIDSVAPAAPVFTRPDAGSSVSTTTPTFTGTAEANASVSVYVDGSGTPACSTTASGLGVFSCVSSALGQGAHTAIARATDSAGNVSSNSASLAFSVDTAAPAAPTLTRPDAGSTVATTTPTFSGTAESGATVSVFVDGSSTAACSGLASGIGGAWSCISSVLAQGAHAAVANAMDLANNVSANSATLNFTIDSVAPSAPTISTPAQNDAVSTTTPTFAGMSEALATVRVYVDGSMTPSCTTTANGLGAWTCTSSALGQGVHAAIATATDSVGNLSGNSSTRDFTVDTVAPSAPSILVPVADALTSATPVFSGNAEAGATVSVYVDGSMTAACTATANGSGAWSCTSSALAQGAHNAVAQARDAALNVSTSSASRAFTVDTVAPSAPTISVPAASAFTSLTPTFSGMAEANAVVRVFVDGSMTPACTTTADMLGAWTCQSSSLSEGPHTAVATATDAAGNGSAASASRAFTADGTAPAAPTIAAPAQNSTLSDNTPMVSGTAEAGATVRIYVDGSVVAACTTTADINGAYACEIMPSLMDGMHSVRASATDASGNVSALSMGNGFAIDSSTPASPILASPTNGTLLNVARPVFSGTATAGHTVRVYIDGSMTPVCSAVADSMGLWSCTATSDLSPGMHSASAVATNLAGTNSAPTAARTFAIDTEAPLTPTLSQPLEGSVTNDPTPRFGGTGEPGASVAVFLDGSMTPTCTATVGMDGTWTCDAPLAISQGGHQVTVRQTDGAGNASPSTAPVTFSTQYTAPPTPLIVAPAQGATLADATPSFSGTAAPGVTVAVFVDGSMMAVCTATASVTGAWSCEPTMALGEGAHAATVSATDSAGNVSTLSLPRSFVIDTGAPVAPVVLVPAANAITGSRPTFGGTGEPGATVVVNVDGQAVCNATVNTLGQWSCVATVTLTTGAHTATSTQTDPSGNASPASASVSFTVDVNVPNPPVVVVPANGASTNQTTPTVSGTADANMTVNVYLDGAMMAACTATANAMGAWSCAVSTPLATGPHTVFATGTNAAMVVTSASNTNTFTVDTMAPTAPAVSSPIPGSTVTTGRPVIAGTAEPGATITVTVDGMPACTATADAQGSWQCSPTQVLGNGPHTIAAVATDAAGNASSSTTSTFTVASPAPAAPIITSPVAGSKTTNPRPTFSGTGAAGTTIDVKVDGVSVCTTVATPMAMWSCTPTADLANGPHSVVATSTAIDALTPSTSAAVDFTIDNVAPDTTIVSGPEASTDSSTADFTFSATEDGATFECQLDGDGFKPCSSPYQVVDLAAGDHVFQVRATDALGNRDASAAEWRWSITVPVKKPRLQLAGGGISCVSSSVDGSALVALAALVLLRPRRRARALAVAGHASARSLGRASGALLAFALVMLPASAKAQVGFFELERLTLNPAGRDGLLLQTGDTFREAGDFRVSLSGHYEHRPLVYLVDGANTGAVIAGRVGMHLAAAVALARWFEVGLQMPVLVGQWGGNFNAFGLPALQGVSYGTPNANFRFGILNELLDNPFDLAIQLGLPLPIGSALAYTRETGFALNPSLGFGKRIGLFRLGAQVGAMVRFRKAVLSPGSSVVSDEIGTEVRWGAQLTTVNEGGVRGELAVFGQIPVVRSPVNVEVMAGVRWAIGWFELYALGGPGFGRAPGTPAFRVLAGVGLSNALRMKSCVEGEPYDVKDCDDLDKDGDGIKNALDACPLDKGLEQLKGCPDTDDDADGILNLQDKCPQVAGESAWGGCPAPDRDKDKVLDADDKCPDEFGPKERQGCPVKDRDGDGVEDSADKCPDEKGVVENFGCPDKDTDGDTVPDRIDNCKEEKGDPANQGCPAAKKQLVVITSEKLIIKDKVYFATGKAKVLPKSFGLLDQVAAVLKGHPEILSVVVEGHTDSQGKRDANLKLSQARTEAVRTYLVGKGILPKRLKAKGWGPDKPAASNETADGREQNRRVEFVIEQ